MNLGEWILFEETTPIAYFTMTGNYAAKPVLEPGTLLLLGCAVHDLAGIIRRKLTL